MIPAKRRRIFRLMFVALWLIGCGPGPTASSSVPPVTSTASATPSPPTLIVLADPDRWPPPTQAITLRLVRPDGSEVNRLTLRPGVVVLAAAGTHIFVLSGGHLKTVQQDGSIVDQGPMDPAVGRIVPSPDGTRWLWSTYAASGTALHSTVYLGGEGLQPRTVEDVMEANRALAPFSWTSRGAFVVHSPVGIGGYILFDVAYGPIDRLDPATWQVTAEARSIDCAFSDEAADGTLMCFPRGGGQRTWTLAVVAPTGSQRTAVLPRPQYAQFGDAYFDPTGTLVAVGGASAAGADGKPEQYSSGLVTVATGALTPFGPSGVRPAMGSQCWLPDGRLVLWRPVNAAGGPPGIFVVDHDGNAAFIASTGVPVGQITAP